MKVMRNVVGVCCLVLASAAMAAPASEASVRQLLEITNARGLVDTMKTRMEGTFGKAFDLAADDKKPSPAQQAAIEKMKARMEAVLTSYLDWSKLETVYVRVYQESFSEEDIQGMLSFYQTPAGGAVVEKMPLVMQKSAAEMQDSFKTMMPELQKIQTEFVAEMKTAAHNQ